jgi:Ca2+-binding RTX toxin-like protein
MTLRRAVGTIACALLSLFLIVPSAPGAIKPGDLLIVDDHAFGTSGCSDPNGCGGVIKVDPATGQQTALSNNAISTADVFSNPTYLAIDSRGRLWVSQYDEFDGNNGALIRVDPATGQATLVSDTSISSEDLFVDPFGVEVDRAGRVLVLDASAFGGAGGVIRVDPATGQQTEFSSAAISGQDLFVEPFGSTIGQSGRLLAADISAFGDGLGGIIAVSDGGQQSAVTSNAISTPDVFAGPLDAAPYGARSLIVADYQMDGGTGGVILVQPSGQASVLSSNTISTTELFGTPFGIASTPAGRILVADEDSQGLGSTGAVIDVNPSTGQQTALSTNDISGPDLFVEPDGITVVPPRCGGRFATIVGTTGRDVIKGSRFADVIATLGGRDRVRGLAGADRICGGKGPDRLFGQGGADRIFGQGGNDRLRGGKGRDRLRGGAGRDRQVQ